MRIYTTCPGMTLLHSRFKTMVMLSPLSMPAPEIQVQLQDRIGSAQAINHHSHDMQRKFGFPLNKKIKPLALDR